MPQLQKLCNSAGGTGGKMKGSEESHVLPTGSGPARSLIGRSLRWVHSLQEQHTIIIGCPTQTHTITTVLETFRAASHQKPSTFLWDRLITSCFLGLIVSNAMRFPRHLATVSCHKPPLRPLIDRIRSCNLTLLHMQAAARRSLALQRWQVVYDVCRSAQPRSAQAESASGNSPSPAQARKAFARLPADHCSRHTRGYGGSRERIPTMGPERQKKK